MQGGIGTSTRRLTSVCSWRARDLWKTFISVAAEGSPAAETQVVSRLLKKAVSRPEGHP